jgi:hypothetical protein
VFRFPLKGEMPDVLNWHRIDEHYDLTGGADVSLKPEEYCDRIIHSFVFSPIVDEQDYLTEFHFTSDRMRRHAIWMIMILDVCDLIKKTGKDYPSSAQYFRDAEGQLITWAGHGEPPAEWVSAAKRRSVTGSVRTKISGGAAKAVRRARDAT